MARKQMKKVLCEVCGDPIHPDRLEFLPETTTCVKCSQTQPYSSEDIRGLYIGAEDQPDGVNMEDFDDGGPDYSVSQADY